MRKLDLYTRKYGEEMGRRLYHALQSQAAHAGVSARLRRKIDALTGHRPAGPRPDLETPLFELTGEPFGLREGVEVPDSTPTTQPAGVPSFG